MSNPLAPLPVALPFSTAALLTALNRFVPRRWADALAISTSIATAAICGLLLLASSTQPIVYWLGGWTPRAGVALGISFVVDSFSAGLAGFVALLVLAAFVFSIRYFESVGTLFHVLMLVFLGAMCGFALTGDLFNLFVFFELMSAAAFALCGYKNEEPQSMQGALNFGVTNTIGAFLTLSGIGLLYGRTGALNMAQIGRALDGHADALVITSFVLVMCGFLVKAAVVPFHFWLADAHAVAPTPVCILFSGVMVELGLYAVVRVYWSIMDGPFAAHRPAVRGLLLVVGALTAVVGALMCFAQRHVKRLLAFSTVSHMGLMTLGFATLAPKGLAGSSIYALGHGMTKAALFIVAGILLNRFATVDELELRGQARDLRGIAILFFFSGLALSGLPPFATFQGEHAIEAVAEKLGQHWVAWVFFFASSLTAAAVFRVCGRVFLGMGKGEEEEIAGGTKTQEEPETTSGRERRIPAVMSIPAVVLALGALGTGLVPGIQRAALSASTEVMDRAGYQARTLDSAWLPISLPEQPEPVAAGALLRSAGATALALLLAWFALSPYWPAKKPYLKPLQFSLFQIRRVHSGHVGDYVAFLTFGVAAFGAVLVWLVR